MNGGGDPLALQGLMAPAPMPIYSNRDIVDMVDQHERDTEALRTRMEQDYSRYRLTSHVNRDRDGTVLEDYAVYTTNAPRVFADKVISWQTLAELLIRVPHLDAGQHPEEGDNLKERFVIGCLRSADERLKRMLQASLRGQLAFYATVRGGYVGGRCLLAKNPVTGKTYADITAWDPMHIHWGLGNDGLKWVCYKIKMTRAQIRETYGVDVGSGGAGGLLSRTWERIRGSNDAEKEGIWVYDFYDEQINTVVSGGDTLKMLTPHGSPRVPAFLVLVGSMPMLQSEASSDLAADVGESVFAGAREVWDKKNDLMSIFQEIVERARRQTVVAESPSGKTTLDENPFVYPTTISTRTGDRIYTLELQKMAAETMAYLTVIMGEEQRATLPYSAYGETPFQLSGFAITQLRQATETVLSSRLDALTAVYTQIANLLYDQFETGNFDGMSLSGMDSGRNYFNQTITPEQIAQTCDYTVKLESQLPQDDASKWAQAEIAQRTQLMSDGDILDNVLGIQDSKQALDKVMAQKAARGLPEAILYTLALAAAERGEEILANMYVMEYQRLMAVKMGMMPPSPTDGAGGGGGQNQPKGPSGQRPEVMPHAQTGAAPQPETSNQGASLVAPGTPRPGAQDQSA